MITFRLWAPRPDRVELLLGEVRIAMSRDAGGWWRADADASPGDDYAFSLDGGPARPDPRAMDLPRGVHGAARLVDHDAYEWRVPHFRAAPLASAVIYELHVGTFTAAGTLDGAIERLDHLRALGVTHVELLPLNAFDGERGWGYDGVAWFAPHRAYTGPDGPDAVKRFVDACHERDLAVVLDVVYNHLGPSGNYLAEFGPYFSDAYRTTWGDALNLDGAGSDEVRRLICDNALMWLRDYRFDGLRLDAVHAFHDRSARHLIEQITDEVRRLEARVGRPLAVIAESDLNDPRVVRPTEAGGYGADAQWSDDFHHAVHALLTGERSGYYEDFGDVAHLAKALTNAFVYDGRHSPHRGRVHGRTPAGVPASRFLAYSQNHDQIGNRAAGDRLAALVDDDAVRAAAALVLLSPFVPMLFQGEEWGTHRPFQYFTDHQDPDLADAVRTGRRSEFSAFGWRPEDVPDPQDPATFERSKLDWSELDRPRSGALLDWYRSLIDIRRRFPVLTDPRLERVHATFDESERWLVQRRGSVLLACSFADEPRRIPWDRLDLEPTPATMLLASDAGGAALQSRASDDPAPTGVDDDGLALAPGATLVAVLAPRPDDG